MKTTESFFQLSIDNEEKKKRKKKGRSRKLLLDLAVV